MKYFKNINTWEVKSIDKVYTFWYTIGTVRERMSQK